MARIVLFSQRLNGLPQEHPLRRALQRARPVGPAPAFPWQVALSAVGLAPQTTLAGLCALAEGLEVRSWLRMDPVALVPNREHLVMAGNTHLDLTREEAEELAESLARWELLPGLCRPHPCRWYLPLDDPPGITTRPWGVLLGKNVRSALPEGPQARTWRARLAELEMALFDAPVNRRRRERGRPTVDSLWPWGEGVAPPPPSVAPSLAWLAGNGVLARGIATWAGIPWLPLGEPLPPGEGLVLLDDGVGGPDVGPDDGWWASLPETLRLVVVGEQEWQVSPRRWWAFWRR